MFPPSHHWTPKMSGGLSHHTWSTSSSSSSTCSNSDHEDSLFLTSKCSNTKPSSCPNKKQKKIKTTPHDIHIHICIHCCGQHACGGKSCPHDCHTSCSPPAAPKECKRKRKRICSPPTGMAMDMNMDMHMHMKIRDIEALYEREKKMGEVWVREEKVREERMREEVLRDCFRKMRVVDERCWRMREEREREVRERVKMEMEMEMRARLRGGVGMHAYGRMGMGMGFGGGMG